MDPASQRIRSIVRAMRPLPTLYVNPEAGVVFNVEHQSALPRVLRLIRRDMDAVTDVLDGLEGESEAFDSYDSFAITYGIPMPILVAHFGHRLRRSEGSVVEVGPSPRPRSALGLVRAVLLQLRTGVMSVSAADRRVLADQLAGAEPEHLGEAE